MPVERGDSPKASDVVDSWHSAKGAPCHEGLYGDLHHPGEALDRQLAQAGKEMLNQTEKSKCMRSTLTSGSNKTIVTRSRLGTRSTSNASSARKEWITRPERTSDVRAILSSRTVLECATRITASSEGIAPVPRAFANNGGGHGGPGTTMTGSGGSIWRQRQGRPTAVDRGGS